MEKAPQVPVVSHRQLDLEAGEQRRLKGIAETVLRNEPALNATHAFGRRTRAGIIEGPMLVIGDHSEIALTRPGCGPLYEYRLSLLAREGDLVAISEGRSLEFENYRKDTLDLGVIELLEPAQSDANHAAHLAERCRLDEAVFARIVKVANEGGGLTLLPHIGMGSAWVLAGAVADASGCEVRVAAPPPRLTRRANDKLWFAEQVRQVLGKRALPPVRGAYGPSALAGQVRALSSSYERTVIKVPDSAGSMGNLSLRSSDIRDMKISELSKLLVGLLRKLGWEDRYPLLVEVWDCPVLSSPSVQLWIPHGETGVPAIEGSFEQIVEGSAGEFIGAIPAQLPSYWDTRLSIEALQLATLLQYCGYFGRCSFDSVITGESYESAELHWIECNARWGGVSIPMTVINRLIGDWAAGSFVVVQRNQPSRPRRIRSAVRLLGDDLYTMHDQPKGTILLTPTGIENGTGLHLAVLGDTRDEAKQIAERSVRALCNAGEGPGS